MESVKISYKGAFIVTLAAILCIHSEVAEGKSLLGLGRELHPIDVCIFSCDMCFKGEALLNCANECITTEANMSPTFIRTCSIFAENPFHGLRGGGGLERDISSMP